MRRSYDKHIRLTKEERDDWQRKAAMTCLNESSLIRLLMKGYAPKEKPDERFFEAMRELSAIGNNINQIARSVNAGIAKPDDAKHGLYMLDRVYELMYQVAKK